MAYFNVTTDGAVTVVTIENPPANAISTSVLQELAQVVDRVAKDASCKACVLTGAGAFFIAGADIKELSGMDLTKGQVTSQNGQRILNTIEQMDKPWIAAINGSCLGGGMELALACHMRIAAEDAKLGLPEIRLGIIPGFGGTQRLPRMTTLAKSYEMILTGDMILGTDAERMGLINRAVPKDDVVRVAMELAKKITSFGGMAIKAAVQSIRRGRRSMDEGLMFEAERFGKLCATQDMHEGMNAFLEKRPAKFEDR